MEAPIMTKAIGWRQGYEFSVPRPAAGAAAANVSVKFYATNKVSFRIRGAEAATDWSTAEASKGVQEGAWVTHSAQAPVTVAFKVQPETAVTAAAETVSAATGEDGVAAAPAGMVTSSGVELTEAGAGVVLEWKGAGWFQGFVIYYLVDVA